MTATPKLESPGFTISEGTVTADANGNRTVLKFAAPAQRHIEGGFEMSVYAVLFDGDGRFVARRGSEYNRPCVLQNRAMWTHEFETEKLAQAKKLVYDIEYKVDYRRKLTGGELPALPAEADGSDYWRWLALDTRALEDRAVKIEMTFWARQSNFELTCSQTPKVTTDNCRSEFELDLFDADSNICATKNFSASLVCGQPRYEDASLSMERKALRALRFFELRARTEIRALARFEVPRP